jgi:lipoprotein-releasing system permease protein
MQQFRSDRYLFSLVGIIILLVACSNIVSFLILLVNDKKREIAILQSMGASKLSIISIFGFCGLTVGLIGAFIGIFAGVFTLHNIDAIASILSQLQGHDAFSQTFYGTSLPSALSFGAILLIGSVTPILSLLAAMIPAWKASKLQPSTLLRR